MDGGEGDALSVRCSWACQSVGYLHDLPCLGAAFSGDGSLLAINFKKVRVKMILRCTSIQLEIVSYPMLVVMASSISLPDKRLTSCSLRMFLCLQYVTLWEPHSCKMRKTFSSVVHGETFM